MLFWKILAKWTLKLHNLTYKASSYLAIKAEGGKHPKHRITDYHRFFLSKINSKDKVLDIGCGNGSLTFDLAKKADKVVGIDFEKKYIKKAERKNNSPKIEYILGDATDYPFQEKFDVVILSNVLEHIDDRIIFLKKIKPLSNTLLIRVPAIDRDWITLYKKELGVEYRLDQGHFIEYTLESLQKELEDAGYEIFEYRIKFGEICLIAK